VNLVSTVVIELELMDHGVQMRSQLRELLERLDGFFTALGVLRGQLRDAAGGFGNLPGGGGLLGGG